MKLKDLHRVCEILLRYYEESSIAFDSPNLHLVRSKSERPAIEDYRAPGSHPLSAEDEAEIRALGVRRTFMDDGWGISLDPEELWFYQNEVK